jgi:predicted amidohydrolase YtcJ
LSDLILVNANVITMDPAFPKARLVRITSGRIADLSADDTWGRSKNSRATIINCRGKTVVPGFIDAHCHLVSYGDSFVTLDVGPQSVSSISDIQNMIKEAAHGLPPGTWVKGRGYNEFYLAEKRHPTRWDLDAASPVHPVRITHRSGHAHLLNSLALQLVGISDETGDPPGGLIERDVSTGEPTGLLYGMGETFTRFVPPTEGGQADHGILLAGQALSALGITSVHDVSSRNDPGRLDLFRNWRKQGLLSQRVTMALGWEAFRKHPKGDTAFRSDDFVRTEGVKIMIDEITGQLNPSQPELNEMVLRLHQSGFQAALHAIEDGAITAACIAIEYALKASPRAGHRHRIEHCSVCPPALAKRLASSGIMVVTQPAFVYYNGERYLRTVPSKDLGRLYPVATLMRHGVRVAGSSDFPIVPPNPLIGIYGAVSRRSETGEHILPEERITPLGALSLFTVNAAYATRTETTRGSIRPGKLADLAILSGDPASLPEEAIKDIQVDMTIINGQVVWERK